MLCKVKRSISGHGFAFHPSEEFVDVSKHFSKKEIASLLNNGTFEAKKGKKKVEKAVQPETDQSEGSEG